MAEQTNEERLREFEMFREKDKTFTDEGLEYSQEIVDNLLRIARERGELLKDAHISLVRAQQYLDGHVQADISESIARIQKELT